MENKAKGKVKLPPLGQIGVVVKDLDKAMEFYSSIFGMGPWRIVELDVPEVKLRGQTYPWKGKIAFTQFGPVEFELIQHLAGRSIHAEGLHHLGFFVSEEEKDRIIEELAKEGIGVIQSGKSQWHSGGYACLDTQKVGGVIFELIH